MAALVALAALLSLAAMDGGVDDASIVHRYADRAAGGAGLTFNDGERVEGFTSLSWTLLLTGACLLGIPAAAAGLALNGLAIVLTALVLERVLWRQAVAAPVRLAALLLYAISYPFFAVCWLGLEFGLYALLLTLFGERLVAWRESAGGLRPAALTGLLGGFLFMTRPESGLLLPLFMLVRLTDLRRGREARRALAAALAAWIVVVLAVTAWRLAYFGELVPNSMLAKAPAAEQGSLGPPAAVLAAGWDYLAQASVANPLVPFLAAVALVLALALPGERGRRLLPLLPAVPGIYVALVGGGDWMPNYRFVWVVQPLLLVAGALGVERLRRRAPGLAVACGLAALALCCGAAGREASWHWPLRTVRASEPLQTYEAIGRALDPVWSAADIAVPEAIGRFGAAAPRVRIHDHCGLTDRGLSHDPEAQRNIYGRINWGYSLGLKPALIILHFPGHAAAWPELDPEFPAGFLFGRVPRPEVPDRPLWVVLRRDRAGAYGPALAAAGMVPAEYADFHAAAEGR